MILVFENTYCFHIKCPLLRGQLLHIVFQLCPGAYTRPCLCTLIYGSFKIFFKDNFDYVGFSLYMLTLEPNPLQEDETSPHGKWGVERGEKTDMEILPKSYNRDKARKRQQT